MFLVKSGHHGGIEALACRGHNDDEWFRAMTGTIYTQIRLAEEPLQ